MMLLAEIVLCLNLGSSFAFSFEAFISFREGPWIYKTLYLQECALAILSNAHLFKILSLGVIYLSGSSLRNESFTHLESI